MEILKCQDNFVGFLSAFYQLYYNNKTAEEIEDISQPNSLLNTYIEIPESLESAIKVREGIVKKGGTKLYDEVLDVYRSNNKNKLSIIKNYLVLFFKHGKKLREMFELEEVVLFNDVVRKVWHEVHRLSAFIRLKEMKNGIFYGHYTSDNDILEKLMPNYIPQFNSQKFILHDVDRRKMAFYDGEKTHFGLAPESIEIQLSDEEILFQKLWKQYHANVNIQSRKNSKLQMAFLPKKYRHFMSEF